MRKYKCLDRHTFITGNYKLIPIRDEDRFQIMQWRNEQIEILRQKTPLTIEEQNIYFQVVVSKLFEDSYPSQLLFSFLENDKLIGYGGLVHIDWESKNGEISFITETGRNKEILQFKNDWNQFLKLLTVVATIHLRFNKIYTYAYDIRPMLFETLVTNNFIQEALLKNHILINGYLHNVLIHSYFCKSIILKQASEEDILLYFNWANEEAVRKNSFDTKLIPIEEHITWFSQKIKDPNSSIFVANFNNEAIGQVRFDQTANGIFEIDFSVAVNFRGLGLGSELIKIGLTEFCKKRTDIIKIIAKVKKQNEPSKKIFEKAGFERSVPESDIYDSYYVKCKT